MQSEKVSSLSLTKQFCICGGSAQHKSPVSLFLYPSAVCSQGKKGFTADCFCFSCSHSLGGSCKPPGLCLWSLPRASRCSHPPCTEPFCTVPTRGAESLPAHPLYSTEQLWSFHELLFALSNETPNWHPTTGLVSLLKNPACGTQCWKNEFHFISEAQCCLIYLIIATGNTEEWDTSSAHTKSSNCQHTMLSTDSKDRGKNSE